MIHELAQRGYKTDAEITKLRLASQAGGARAERVLNQVSQQAEEAMVRFRGLSRTERQVISRAIFIYPWMKGATRYLGRLPLDRPVAADVVGNLGQRGDAETKRILGRLVSFLEGISPAGKIEHKLGTDLLPVRNFGAVTPFSTGAQALQIAEGVVKGVVHGTPAPAAFNVGSLAQPVRQSLIEGRLAVTHRPAAQRAGASRSGSCSARCRSRVSQRQRRRGPRPNPSRALRRVSGCTSSREAFGRRSTSSSSGPPASGS
jgi:hypothetical protein